MGLSSKEESNLLIQFKCQLFPQIRPQAPIIQLRGLPTHREGDFHLELLSLVLDLHVRTSLA